MKRFFAKKWVLALLVSIVTVFFGATAIYAATTGDAKYVLYWPKSNANDLKPIFDDGEKSGDLEGVISVLARGGLFGNKGRSFSFTSDINNQLNKAGGGDDASDNYYAVTQLYCQNDKIKLTEPSSGSYQEIDYTLGFHANDWNNIQNDDTRKAYSGITKITDKSVGDSGRGEADTDSVVFEKGSSYKPVGAFVTNYFNPTKLPDHGEHGGKGDDWDDHLSSGCTDQLSRGSFTMTNYYALSDAEKKQFDKIIDEAGLTSADGSSGTGGDDIPCRGGPMGWLMCPLIEIMSEALQTVAGFIDSMMQFRLLSQTNSQEALRNVWQTFLNIANVFLVIAFLVIIFSQTTSAGLSNYGIKRMLPRLVMGAILMNISFYICAFAIDISNIIGSSVMGLFANMADIANWNFTDSDGVVKEAFTDKSGADGLGTGFIKYLGAGIAAVVIILFFLVPVVLSALLVFVVLVARQVILTVLVVVAPLAFVAWLLPNTEQYFKKWWGLFSQMLFAYPMVMAVFGAAIFVAELIQGVNQINSQVDAPEIGGPGVISAIVPLRVLGIPLFVIPKLIMSTNSILGKVGGTMQKGFKASGLSGLGDKQRKAAWGITGKPMADRAGYEVKRSRPGRFFRNRAARGKAKAENRNAELARQEAEHVARYNIENADDTTAAGRRSIASSQATLDKLKKEEVENAKAGMKARFAEKGINMNDHKEVAKEMLAARVAGDKATERAAMEQLLSSGGGTQELASRISSGEVRGDSLDMAYGAIQSEGKSVFNRNPALAMAADGKGDYKTLLQDGGTYSGINAEDFAGMRPEAIAHAIKSGGADAQVLQTIASSDSLKAKVDPKVAQLVQHASSNYGAARVAADNLIRTEKW